LQHALALDAGAQQDRQQLDVALGAGATRQLFFTWASIRREVFVGHWNFLQ
jgi:hypothetical protein